MPNKTTQELTILTEKVNPQWLKTFEIFALQAISVLGFRKWELSITFCNDQFIQTLNRQWRGKDEPTDILSFEADSQYHWAYNESIKSLCGDLVLSLETLKDNCIYFNINEEEELKRLTIHGLLHLCGWNHNTNQPTEPMLIQQEEILKTLKEVKIF